jgi:hypothetical protein
MTGTDDVLVYVRCCKVNSFLHFLGKIHELEIRFTRAEERARDLETIASVARDQMLQARQETDKAKKDAQLALLKAEQTMIEKKGEEILNLALQCKILNSTASDQVYF